MSRYAWSLLPKLASNIEHGRPEASHDGLDILLQITGDQSRRRIPVWKLRCAQMAGACLRGALRGGASGEELIDDHLKMIDRLNSVKGERQLRALMHGYVGQLLRQVGSARHTSIEHAVGSIRKRIRQSLRNPRTLADYARALGLSFGHLSRSFSRIAGRSFREEVRQARIDAACGLLTRTSLKIKAITSHVGLRDPSQFIACFRAEKGVTPGQYRKSHFRRPLPLAKRVRS